MGLSEDVGRGPVAIDTAPLIYLIEEHADYLPVVAPLFADADRGRFDVVTSALTLLEVLVVPLRVGRLELARRYGSVLTRARGLHLVDLDRDQLRAAAQLRASYRVRTPDALQIAACLSYGCSAFLTNDRRLPNIPGLQTLQLQDYL